MDKLDGNVDPEMFEHLSADWRKHQDKCLREIHRHQSADEHYLEEGITVLERHHRSRDGKKRAALVRSRAADGETAAPKFCGFELHLGEWRANCHTREPFGFIAEMAKFTLSAESGDARNFADHSGWLGN
jgi:hypothetical protein